VTILELDVEFIAMVLSLGVSAHETLWSAARPEHATRLAAEKPGLVSKAAGAVSG